MSNVNILNDFDALRVFSSSGVRLNPDSYPFNWTTTNASVALDTDVDVRNSITDYVLVLQPSDTNDFSLRLVLNNVNLSAHILANLIAHAKVQSENIMSVTGTLKTFATAGESETTTVFPGTYIAVRTGTFAVAEGSTSESFEIIYNFSGHGGKKVLFTLPHFHDDFGFFDYSSVRAATNYVPRVFLDRDTQSVSPTYPFTKLLSTMSLATQESLEFYKDFFDWEKRELTPEFDDSELFFRSGLVDPYAADVSYLRWLSQANGTVLKSNVTETTYTFVEDSAHPPVNVSSRGAGQISYIEFLPTSPVFTYLTPHKQAVTSGVFKVGLAVDDGSVDASLASFVADAFANGGLYVKGRIVNGAPLGEETWYKLKISSISDGWQSNGASTNYYRFTVTEIWHAEPDIPVLHATIADVFDGVALSSSSNFTVKNTVDGLKLAFMSEESTLNFYTDNEPYLRWQVNSGAYGINAGTSQAVVDAAKQVLTGDKKVGLLPLYGLTDGGFGISVRTIASETPDYDLATLESPTVVDAIQKALPAGYVVYHQALEGLGFVLGNASLGVLGENALG